MWDAGPTIPPNHVFAPTTGTKVYNAISLFLIVLKEVSNRALFAKKEGREHGLLKQVSGRFQLEHHLRGL